jgi:hypothetical protein
MKLGRRFLGLAIGSLRNADLCSTAVLRLIGRKSKQPRRLAPKSRSIQLNAEKMSAICCIAITAR